MKKLMSIALCLACILEIRASVSGTEIGLPPEGYCPPLISNGDLNMLVDWWGGQGTNEYYSLNTEIYWQGRRSVAREARLFGFGRFNPMLSIDGKDAGLPLDWSQTLDVTNAFVETIGSYDRQTTVGVAEHQYGIRAGLYHHLVTLVDNVAHRRTQIITHGIHIDVRVFQFQVLEEYSVQVIVIILSGMGQESIEIFAAFVDDCCQTDNLRAGAHDNE
jgi:hypothetical protein